MHNLVNLTENDIILFKLGLELLQKFLDRDDCPINEVFVKDMSAHCNRLRESLEIILSLNS